MNDYGPYVAAVYLLSLIVYGGYIFRWRHALKRITRQLDAAGSTPP